LISVIIVARYLKNKLEKLIQFVTFSVDLHSNDVQRKAHHVQHSSCSTDKNTRGWILWRNDAERDADKLSQYCYLT
jgi:hypothetical protein